MRTRRWPRTAHLPPGQASRWALTGQKASIAGNGSGRRLVCCSPRYGMHTPADGRLGRRSVGSRPAQPEPGIPGSNTRLRAGEPQQRGHVSSVAGSQEPFTPSEQPASSTSQVRLIPLAAPPAVYASADIPRKIPESAAVPHWFGREPVTCPLAAAQPSSTTTASPAWARTNGGESERKASGTCRQETMSFVRKRRNASATRTTA
jgi:hypothetical protein